MSICWINEWVSEWMNEWMVFKSPSPKAWPSNSWSCHHPFLLFELQRSCPLFLTFWWKQGGCVDREEESYPRGTGSCPSLRWTTGSNKPVGRKNTPLREYSTPYTCTWETWLWLLTSLIVEHLLYTRDWPRHQGDAPATLNFYSLYMSHPLIS